MFTESQAVFLAEIITQYDYYVAYYYGTYKEYNVGEIRDYKIEVYCSDQKPNVDNGVYHFTECNYYEVTNSKYLLMEQGTERDFTPLSSSDIVYTNAVEGMPQLDYTVSQIRQDAGACIMYGTIGIASIAILVRLIFGGKA